MRNFILLRSKFAVVVVSAVIAMLPLDGYALSFGKLQVESELGQPLKLQIPLESVSSREAETFAVTLGSREDFAVAGVEYPDIAMMLEIELVSDPDGRYHVDITTRDPVREPYLHILLSATWAGGKALREYTALLDPPMYSGKPASAVTLAGGSGATSDDQEAAAIAAEVEAAVAASEQGGGSTSRSASGYTANDRIEVRRGDTLSGIVSNMARPAAVDSIQALEAVFRKNPGAFINNNMNLVRTGATLQVPTFSEMQNISPQESRASYSAQLQAFNEYRNIPAVPSTDQPADTTQQEVAEAEEPAGEDTLAVPDPLPPLSEEGLEGLEETADSGEQPEVDTDTVADVPAQTDEPQLTIGQQEVGAGTESGTGVEDDDEARLDALRSQLAELDENLLASGVESESVRQNLQQIQEQVERMSSLVEIEDQNLAQAQNRVAEDPLAPETGADELEAIETTAIPDLEETTSGQESASTASSDVDTDTDTDTEIAGSAADVSDDGFTSVESAVDPEASVELDVSNEAEPSIAAAPAGNTDADSVNETGQETADPESGTAQSTGAEETAADPAASAEVADSDSTGDETGEATARTVAPSGDMFSGILSAVTGALKGVVSWLQEYGLKVAGGLLVLIGGLFLWQRRKSQNEYDASLLDIETEELSINSAVSSQRSSNSKGSSVSGVDLPSANDDALELTIGGGMSYLSEEGIAGVNEEDNVIKAGEVDPLAEADVYLAYDRDEQAIQVLKEAFADTPERGELAEKLLEIYHKQDDRRSFDALAEEMQRRRSSTSNFSWSKIAVMGREVSPDNPLYESDSAPSGFGETKGSATDLDSEDSLLNQISSETPKAPETLESPAAVEALEDSVQSESETRTVDDSIDVDQLQMLGDVSENTEVRGLEAEDLDFAVIGDDDGDKQDVVKMDTSDDAGNDVLDAPTLSQFINENMELDSKPGQDSEINLDDQAKDDQAGEDSDDVQLGADDLTLILGDDDQGDMLAKQASNSGTAAEHTDREPAGEKSGALDMDSLPVGDEEEFLDDSRPIDSDSGMAKMIDDPGSELEPYHESETALELARAYLELGEQEIAKGFIEEVLAEGSDKQKSKARELIKELA